MIVVDTNVISEVMKPEPARKVKIWMAAVAPATLFTTTITLAEVLHGVELIPAGRRRTMLEAAVKEMFTGGMLGGHMLGFDEAAARAFAQISARRRSLGKPIGEFDAMIAAIALSHGAAVATRNVRDFTDCGVALIDPWA
jgi:predicted nucleic acid-binding protein